MDDRDLEDQLALNKGRLNRTILNQWDKRNAADLEARIIAPDDFEHDEFLDVISGVESSLGKDKDHALLKHGIHKDTRAGGSFGIMPNTVRDLANKIGNTQTTLGQSLPRNFKFDRLKQLASKSNEEITETLNKDPLLDRAVARLLAKEIMQKQGGDEKRAAYAWQYGNNLSPRSISEDKLNKSDRIKKFKEWQKILKAYKQETEVADSE